MADVRYALFKNVFLIFTIEQLQLCIIHEDRIVGHALKL